MKIEESMVRKLTITEVPALDPISVVIEEYEVGQAKVIIQCYDKSWNAYWGSMGGTLSEFFSRTNVPYLVNNFSTELELRGAELDTDAMKQNFITETRKRVIEKRFEGAIGSNAARNVYNECVDICLEDVMPKHLYDSWNIKYFMMCESSWEEVFYSEDGFNEWCTDTVTDIYKDNPDYVYLYRVVSAVREAITGLSEED
ncbi:hypothetical protein NVP1121O_259 [Vibrio phage 1.121.O._10N.286.46.C4]|nr:hypothetical protein NVP1121O_259 [Vibrio phage 1.121.O._10N.286.46.C4]